MLNLMPRASFPDVGRWLESSWPFGERHGMRIEDYDDEGNYVVRAEVPGLDPGKDIKITVDDDRLKILAERTEHKHGRGHSEFRYGSFSRSVPLPRGADTKHIKARYNAGILEVKVPVSARSAESRQIPVTAGGGADQPVNTGGD
jgi:HSP20 family molecular chaperone IbpA